MLHNRVDVFFFLFTFNFGLWRKRFCVSVLLSPMCKCICIEIVGFICYSVLYVNGIPRKSSIAWA